MVNCRIDHDSQLRLQRAAKENTEVLADRILVTGREWDFERIVELEASFTGLAGLILGLAIDRRFLWVPAIAASMLLLHSVQGWYPLLPVLRRFGVRSQDEIDREYYALKALRGDFDVVAHSAAADRAAAAWNAVTL